MTLETFPGDRLFKFIEAKTFDSQRKKFLSKIDKDGKVTVYTYTYDLKDTTPDGRILKRSNRMLVQLKSENEFQNVINVNLCIYPGFEILFERDYSDMTVEQALKELFKDDLIINKGVEKVNFDNNEVILTGAKSEKGKKEKETT